MHCTKFTKYFEYCWFSYLGVHSDRTLPIWASPAKLKHFRPIYLSFKPEKLRQTQEIRETLTKFCLMAYFQNWLRFGRVFFVQININSIYTYRRHHLPGQVPSQMLVKVLFTLLETLKLYQVNWKLNLIAIIRMSNVGKKNSKKRKKKENFWNCLIRKLCENRTIPETFEITHFPK